MKIRMKIGISGTFHNIEQGVKVGDVVEVDDLSGANYIASGYAEAAPARGVEHAVTEPSNEERAILSTEIIGASEKAVPQPRAPRPPKVQEPEPKLEPKAVTTKDVPTPTKRSPVPPRRPRK